MDALLEGRWISGTSTLFYPHLEMITMLLAHCNKLNLSFKVVFHGLIKTFKMDPFLTIVLFMLLLLRFTLWMGA